MTGLAVKFTLPVMLNLVLPVSLGCSCAKTTSEAKRSRKMIGLSIAVFIKIRISTPGRKAGTLGQAETRAIPGVVLHHYFPDHQADKPA